MIIDAGCGTVIRFDQRVGSGVRPCQLIDIILLPGLDMGEVVGSVVLVLVPGMWNRLSRANPPRWFADKRACMCKELADHVTNAEILCDGVRRDAAQGLCRHLSPWPTGTPKRFSTGVSTEVVEFQKR